MPEHEHHHEHCDAHCHEHGHHHHEHGCCGQEHEGEMSLKKLLAAAALFLAAIAVTRLENFGPLGQSLAGSTFTLGAATGMTLFLAAYLACGLGVVRNAARNIFRGKIFDEQFLMAAASIGAVCLGEHAEAVAVMLFYQIGEFFQDYALGRSERSISALMELCPDTAVVLRDGREVSVRPDEVAVGERIIVRPGERIPLDGVIESGSSFADTSALTGEPVPRQILPGSEVLGGFVNTEGVLTIQVTKAFAESSLSKILELVEESGEKKSKAEQFITRFARVYTPVVIFAALAVALVPPAVFGLLGRGWNFSSWAGRALIFLVVSCPCALVISVPMGFVGGIGAAARKGILVKGSSHLEAMSKVNTAVFDKTGTLTKGVFVVTDISCAPNSPLTREELLAAATHAEFYSTHPIADSLKNAHSCQKCQILQREEGLRSATKEHGGMGIESQIDGKSVLVGSARLMEKFAVGGFVPAESADGTLIHVAVEGSYAGRITIADELKTDTKAALGELKRLGVARTVMLTGDNADSARKIADSLGIDEFHSELLPEGKVKKMEELLQKNSDGTLLFAGDGINDAPVLARADIGVAMGALGSDAAIEAADIVIMTDELSRLAEGIATARRTMRTVRQNITFSLGVKGLAMVLGALGVTGMWFAVFADVGVAFLAVLNSLKLIVTKTK